MIDVIFAFLRFFASPVGVMVWLVGLIGFLTLPLWSNVAGQKFANAHLWLSQFANERTAIVLGAHGDIYHKQMSFSDKEEVEEITFGGQTKLFEDPDDSLSHWLNGKFALADEIHGVLFTPYHAAIGQRKHESEEEGEMFAKATDTEWSSYNVSGWLKGVFEMPKKHELVDLADARHIVSGGERSEWPQRITEYYKHSREPYNDGPSLLRPLTPVFAFLGTFAGMWLIADQGGAAVGATDSVSFGLLSLLVSTAAPDVNWKRLGKIAVAVLVPVALLAGLTLLTNVLFTVLVVLVAVLGFTFMPFLTLLGRPVDKLGGALSGLYLKTGLLGYERPVFEYGDMGYSLHEYDALDTTAQPKWYDFKGTLVGFTFDTNPDAYPEAMSKEDVENRAEVVADGKGSTNVPTGYVRSEEFSRAKYGGFVPKRPSSDSWYVGAGRALKRLAGAAEGQKSQKRLEWAKEEFGVGAWNMSNKTLALFTFLSVIVAAGLGTWLFFL